MRYKLTIPKDFRLPDNQSLITALVKGAMASKDGKPITANPYEADTTPEFYTAWYRGWTGANEGIITVEVPETRHRVLGKEIIRTRQGG